MISHRWARKENHTIATRTGAGEGCLAQRSGGRIPYPLILGATERAQALGSYVNFETGQVRPLAISPDGPRLFAANTPDNCLEIFAIDAAGLTSAAGNRAFITT